MSLDSGIDAPPSPSQQGAAIALSRPGVLARLLRPVLLAGVVSVIVMQIVALSPSSVDESRDSNIPLEPEALLPRAKTTLASGIPSGVPEYSVDQFNYVSTHGSVREWNLIASHAYMYNRERLVHARTVRALLFDPDGKITVVTGQESKYLMSVAAQAGSSPGTAPVQNRDLEIFGDVKTVFPDGFEVRSDYMRYHPDTRIIEVPNSYPVAGSGEDVKSHQLMSFTSRGFVYQMEKGEITLPTSVHLVIEKPEPPTKHKMADDGHTPPVKMDSKTIVESDHCAIDRIKKVALFTMSPSRPTSSRFVHVTQPSMFSKGRWGNLNFGDFGDKLVNYMVLYEDVLLKETGKSSLRYATSGRADFDANRDLVILTVFPQVYQDKDTVTGDRIVLHRDTDVVEVEHSNAFSQGQNQEN